MCYKNEMEDCEPAPQRAAGPTLAIDDLASEYYVSAWLVLWSKFESVAAQPRVALTDEAPGTQPPVVKPFPCPLLFCTEKH
jgi:hypothetical protein